MIKFLILNKKPLIWIIIHALLGVTATVTPYLVIAWFYAVVITSTPYFLKKQKSPYILIALVLYLISFELLSRMARTSPFIPYELGKYLLAAGMIYGIFRTKTFGKLGWIMFLCMLPSLFIDYSGEVQRSDIVFNVLGPINVALACIFFNRQKVTSRQFSNILRMMIYPIISVLTYTILKTPDFDEVEFILGANVDLSGGFGSNQVSTLFGLGALFLFIILINRWKFSGYLLIDAALLFGFSFQGLLTFSRGGMLGAVLGILVILFFIRVASPYQKRKYNLPNIGKYVLPALFVGIVAFVAVDEITGGMLSLRYQGETAGTLQGTKEKSLYSVTTGRLDIFLSDVDLWMDHLFFGVGAGASRFLRDHLNGTVAHVELSRLLAEHGAFGLVYFLILCWLGIKLIKSNPNPMLKGILIAFYLVAIYTSFHAAMRTFVTPALVGLSLLLIKTSKSENTLSRKQTSKTRLQPYLNRSIGREVERIG